MQRHPNRWSGDVPSALWQFLMLSGINRAWHLGPDDPLAGATSRLVSDGLGIGRSIGHPA